MSGLRDAARARLGELGADDAPADGLRRATLEIEAEGRVELVTVTLRPDGTLLVSATDGQNDGPHVRAALTLLAAMPTAGGTRRVSMAPPKPSTAPGPWDDGPEAAEDATSSPGTVASVSPLADALEDLMVAAVRHGANEGLGKPAVSEAIARVEEAVAKSPDPRGLTRFIGRLYTMLATRDAAGLARVLDGASRLVSALRRTDLPKEERRRVEAWLGGATRTQLFDQELVEIGREWIAGFKRGALQRRYLVSLHSGEIYREERRRNEPGSVGPCPRKVVAGLAEHHAWSTPSEMRLLQYAVSPEVAEHDWDRLAELALADFGELGPRYRAALKGDPALAEPVVWLAVHDIDVHRLLVFDKNDTALPLRDDPTRAEPGTALAPRVPARDDTGRLARIRQVALGSDAVRCIGGRLSDAGSVLWLEPFALLVSRDGESHFERLR